MINIQDLIRPHLKDLKPYSSARDEYTGTEGVFLDANENPFGSIGGGDYNRYPDPYQRKLKQKLAQLKRVPANRIFLGNGSDEPIDLLYRAFCDPVLDEVLIMPPTYGMYEVSANINNVSIKRVNLRPDFQIDLEPVLAAITDHTKIIFICSPNNPTGNRMKLSDIESIVQKAPGLVVIDEAYIDFTPAESMVHELKAYSNVVVLQTFSKAWGLAAIRLGMAYAHPEIITILNAIKPPYNISKLTQEEALKALDLEQEKDLVVRDILDQRRKLIEALDELDLVEKIHPTEANFLLMKVPNAEELYNFLVEEKVITRDRSKVELCEECLRVTVGTPQENDAFIDGLKKYSK